MALVSISEAARLAKISRTALYKNYINTHPAKLATTTDEKGDRRIDTSELLRVFGKLHVPTPDHANTSAVNP